jgi:hypothetical protein
MIHWSISSAVLGGQGLDEIIENNLIETLVIGCQIQGHSIKLNIPRYRSGYDLLSMSLNRVWSTF